MKELMSVQEAADVVGVNRRTVNDWVQDGKLKAHRLGGKRRIFADDLRAAFTPVEPSR